MTKFTAGMLIGFSAALAGWWYYIRADAMLSAPAPGEVIFRNTPAAD